MACKRLCLHLCTDYVEVNKEIEVALKEEEASQTKNNHESSSEESITKKNRSKTKKSTTKKSVNKTKNKIKVSEKIVEEEKKEELEFDKSKTKIREIKSSSPIEITQINEISSSEKPKKKGWWSQ